MKIVISANGKDLDSTVNERFGRCPYFLIIETDDMSCQAVENANADLPTGAGIQAASMVASSGAKAVLTGNCGPKAMQVFQESGISTILDQHGVIREIVAAFKSGTLLASSRANAPEKSGAVYGDTPPGFSPPGQGIGGGRGRGGCGRGMGMGGGRGMGRRRSGGCR